MYLSLNEVIIPDHGYVVISGIGSTDDTALLCNTNYLPDGGNSGGNWYGPNGTRVGDTNSITVPGLYRNRDLGLVRLIRDNTTGTPSVGIYSCEIQDNTSANISVFVGLYNNNGGG